MATQRRTYPGGHEYLEEQNNAQETELREKVGLLKELTIQIGDEVKEHNRLLKDADNSFDSVGDLLANSIGKIKQLAKSGYKYYFLYLVSHFSSLFLLTYVSSTK